jgi:hypothetical protein
VAAAVGLQAGLLLATHLYNEQERTMSLNARVVSYAQWRPNERNLH